jgi:hypothetical protein
MYIFIIFTKNEDGIKEKGHESNVHFHCNISNAEWSERYIQVIFKKKKKLWISSMN